MASGRQLADQYVATFSAWLASKSDADFRQMVSRGVLSRREIAAECGFGKSVLDQNPRIRAALLTAEAVLRERGILPPLVERSPDQPGEPLMREAGVQKAIFNAERLKRLEQENASLRAENDELKRQLKRFAVLREALATTGRLPR